MTDTKRGATIQFGGSPWAREALLADEDRAVALAHQARDLGVSVSIIGKSLAGPWVVRVWTTRRALRFAGSKLHDTVAFGLERWAAGADDRDIDWRAGAGGLAHGQGAKATRTLCGERAIEERYRHPEKYRCQACWRALDGQLRRVA